MAVFKFPSLVHLRFLTFCVYIFSTQMRTPVHNVDISGKMDRGLPYHLMVKKVYDDSRFVNADLVIDPRTRTLEFTMVYDAGNVDHKYTLFM